MTDGEIKIKKIYFDRIKQIDLFQESYFLYDRSNVIKELLLTKSMFLLIYCSGSFFGETDKEKTDLITGKNSLFLGGK